MFTECATRTLGAALVHHCSEPALLVALAVCKLQYFRFRAPSYALLKRKTISLFDLHHFRCFKVTS